MEKTASPKRKEKRRKYENENFTKQGNGKYVIVRLPYVSNRYEDVWIMDNKALENQFKL